VSAADKSTALREPSLSLESAFTRGVRNNALAEALVQFFRVSGRVVLARGLKPADFGAFKSANVIVNLLLLFSDGGLPEALVQRKELREDHQAATWWLTVSLTVMISALLYFSAPTLAAIMSMRSLDSDLRMLCLPVLVAGTAATACAKLRRELRFGAIALAEVTSEVTFLVTALLLMAKGFARVCLIAGLACRLSISGLILLFSEPYVPTSRPSFRAAKELMRFSLSAWGARLITTLAFNIDFLLVGALLGNRALGLYVIAWELLRFIPDRLYRVMVRVALPTFARIQDDDRRLAGAYCAMVDKLARFVLPALACAVIAAPELISVVYGTQWSSAAPLLRMLAPGLAMVGLRSGIGSIYYSKGRPEMDIYLNGLRTILIVLTVCVLARQGLKSVCVGMSVVEGAIGLIGQSLVCKLVGSSPTSLVRAVSPALRATLWCAIAAVGVKIVAAATGAPPSVSLAALLAVPALILCFCEFDLIRELLSAKPRPLLGSQIEAQLTET